MEQNQFLKQIIEFNRVSFTNSYDMIAMMQDQAERMTSSLLSQTTWFPEEGRNMLAEWIKACKNGQENVKKNIDDSLKKAEELFSAQS